MSVTFNSNVYGLTGTGRKVVIGKVNDTVSNAFLCSGKIFYIDESVDSVYHFYDRNGEEITDVQVGDSPYAYTVDGDTTKKKYYVCHETNTSARWTYNNGSAWVYNEVGGTSNDIGKGKLNTDIVMAASSGAYIKADSAGDGSNVPTIWYVIKQLRDNNVGGSNDWYAASREEIRKAEQAVDRNGNHVVNTSNSSFSSSESGANNAWEWHNNDIMAMGKGSTGKVIGVRSF